MEQLAIPCTIMRGGTSRALFFLDSDLPSDPQQRYQVLLNAAGTQDETRIDGLVGQLSNNSKIAIIKKSNLPNIDLEFEFGQVHLTKNMINFDGTCGNIISAVGVYALHKKLINAPIDQKELIIHILDTNTKIIAKMTIPVKNGQYDCSQPYCIPGVANPTGKIVLDYADAINENHNVFPTGNKQDKITLESGFSMPISLTNVLGEYVFVKLSDFNGDGAGLTIDDNSPEFLQRFKEIRGKAAVLAGMLDNWQDVDELQPVVPRVVFMLDDTKVSMLNIIMVAVNKIHNSIAGSAAISLAAAAKLPGTIPYDLYDETEKEINVQHPAGTIQLIADCTKDQFQNLSIERNARVIMDGVVYVSF